MHSCLLKKLLPFTLTFVVGAGVGGLFKVNRARTTMWTWSERATPLLGHEGPFGYERHRNCRMYRRNLVAETRPLVILFKPDAVLPYRDEMGKEGNNLVSVSVTFGADGKVHAVEQLPPSMPDVMKQAVERAARQIQFEPETVNSVPITVTKDIEIQFMPVERR